MEEAAADPERGRARPTRPTASASPTTRSPARYQQWKDYRGGTVSRIWLYNTKDHAIEKMPQPADARQRRRPDVDRRHGLLPLRSRRRVQPLRLRHEEQAGPPGDEARRLSGAQRRLRRRPHRLRAGRRAARARPGVRHERSSSTIGVASDLRETRARFVKGARWIRDVALSPTGARAAFGFRGEIVTVPGEKGDVRNLTNSVGAPRPLSRRGRPDGRSIAWFSDASGEYQLYIGSAGRQG